MAKPRKSRRKPAPDWVKEKADAAERRAKGLPLDKPRKPIDPPAPKEAKGGKPPAPTPAPPLPKIGRPTKYRPAFCQRVVVLGTEGKSKAQMAAALGIARENMDDWEKRHPEFRHAVKCAQGLALAWWEDRGQRGVGEGKDFNSVAFIFQMKNRFRDDYADRFDHGLKLDATEAFLRCVQEISKLAAPKLEANP